MKNWNRTGKIKSIILGLCALPNLLFPTNVHHTEGIITTILLITIFGVIAIPLISKFNSMLGAEIVKPTWNDNPLVLKRPLSFAHFGSYFFLVTGLSVLIGTGIKFQQLNTIGLVVIFFGFGIMMGVLLTLRLQRRK